jgi:hypothetical protein
MDQNHLIVVCTLHDQGNVIKSHTMIDCGTTGFAFKDKDYAHHHYLPLHYLKLPKHITVIDEWPITSESIIHIVHTYLAICNYQTDIPLFIAKLEYYPIVLEIPCILWHYLYLCFT